MLLPESGSLVQLADTTSSSEVTGKPSGLIVPGANPGRSISEQEAIERRCFAILAEAFRAAREQHIEPAERAIVAIRSNDGSR